MSFNEVHGWKVLGWKVQGWNVQHPISSLPFLSDIDIYINGGFEPEEVEIEIDAIDEIFVPTNQGKVLRGNSWFWLKTMTMKHYFKVLWF